MSGDGDADMALAGTGDFATTPSTLKVTPSAPVSRSGNRSRSAANRAVDWSVVRGWRGQIDGDGRYTAPSVAGVFHVHAVASDGSGDEVFATVTVSEHALTFVAGGYGSSATPTASARRRAFERARHGLRRRPLRLFRRRRRDSPPRHHDERGHHDRRQDALVDGQRRRRRPRRQVRHRLVPRARRAGRSLRLRLENNTIREIDLATRAVTTVAGMAGTPGFNNGKGTAAHFSIPDRARLRRHQAACSTSATPTTPPSASMIRRPRRSRR